MRTSGYRQTKEEQNEQSFAFAANAILKESDGEGCITVLLTSSYSQQGEQAVIAEKLAAHLKERRRVLLISVDPQQQKLTEISIQDGMAQAGNPSPEKLADFLAGQKESVDIILLNVPPVRLFANALEYAGQADHLYLVEPVRRTVYSEFEKTVGLLESRGLKPSGTILYR